MWWIFEKQLRKIFGPSYILRSTKSGHERYEAAQELAKIGSDWAVRRIIEACNDPDPDVSSNSPGVLSNIIGTVRNPEAIPALIATVLDKHSVKMARFGAAEALGEMGATQAIPALRKVLDDPNASLWAAKALEKLGHKMDALDIVRDDILGCAKDGDLKNIKRIIQNKPETVRSRDDMRRTALHIAARFGNVPIAEVLLDKGADLTSVDSYGWTPLHFCAESNKADMAGFLISRGASIEARDDDHRTPLHRAGEENSMAVAEVLLKQGAEAHVKDSIGRTPADVADACGHGDLAAFLRRHEQD